MQDYEKAMLDFKIDRLTYVGTDAGWKADRANFNLMIFVLRTDLKAFQDEYKPLKLKLGIENTVKPDGKVEPALKLEIDLTGVLNSFNNKGRKELDDLTGRFDELKGDLQGLNALKGQLDDTNVALKKRDSDLKTWYLRIQQKVKDANYKIGMAGGQDVITIALSVPPDAPPDDFSEIALDEEALVA